MNKKLVIVTTDMEIDFAMYVEANKLTNTKEAIAEAREKYWTTDYDGLFSDLVSDVMTEYGIEHEIVEYEEM